MSIAAINKDAVHRICSGQVIVDLTAAVKELLENSLDAKSTSISIALRNYGLDGVEVTDNGTGIDPKDFESVALKHYTSKLQNFDDLASVSTMGFRGEALSSLCAVGTLSITTAQADGAAVKLSFSHAGTLENKSGAARTKGTTVTITNLFATMPVRLKGFQKSAKAEYNKLASFLRGYACICTGVRLSLTNIIKGKSKTTTFATLGNDSIRKNIANVFGTKFVNTLVPVKVDITVKPAALKAAKSHPQLTHGSSSSVTSSGVGEDMAEVDVSSSEYEIHVSGYISKVNEGRSGSDRQYLYINQRPVTYPRVSKLLNELYRKYSASTSSNVPACVLNFNVPEGYVDVNLTPDKRTVLLHHERELLTDLYGAIDAMYAPSQFTYKVRTMDSFVAPIAAVNATTTMTVPTEKTAVNVAEEPVHEEEEEEPIVISENVSASPVTNEIKSNDMKMKAQAPPLSSHIRDILMSSGTSFVNRQQANNTSSSSIPSVSVPSSSEEEEEEEEEDASDSDGGEAETVSVDPVPMMASPVLSAMESDSDIENPPHVDSDAVMSESGGPLSQPIIDLSKDDDVKSLQSSTEPVSQADSQPVTMSIAIDIDQIAKLSAIPPRSTTVTSSRLPKETESDEEMMESDEEMMKKKKKKKRGVKRSRTEMTESEMQRVIGKDDFLRMRVIGQFNLGFIIAHLPALHDDADMNAGGTSMGDLFIIDQHASDEKYRYETLDRDLSLTLQPLVVPLPMDVSPTDMESILEHRHVFRRNGFTFDTKINQESGEQQLYLQAVPLSKNIVFGEDDIHALVHLLATDGSRKNQSQVRPPRVRKMLASRACRSAIMIGTALHQKEMEKVVKHMNTMESPWACPHGRPTMRHLCDLDAIQC